MPARVRIDHEYPVAPQTLWRLVTDLDVLAKVSKGFVTFEGLPSGALVQGQVIEVKFRLFGVFPPQPYRMEVLEVDPEDMRVRSFEFGGGVKSWRHTFQVHSTEQGAKLSDYIEIDAGWLSPLFALYAQILYRSRHKPRLRLLEDGAAQA